AWDYRPDWAAELGIQGIDTDVAMLHRMGVEIKGNISFDQVIPFVSQARFCPVIHRPLFNHLGIVTNRTFETFCSDTVPLLMLPEETVREIYGESALPLMPGEQLRNRLSDMMRHPEVYWEAVLRTRSYLAEHHSYQRCFGVRIQ